MKCFLCGRELGVDGLCENISCDGYYDPEDLEENENNDEND